VAEVTVAVAVLSAVPFLVIPFLNLASRTSGEDGGDDEEERAAVSGVAVEDLVEPLLEVERGDVSPERERGNFIRGINPVLADRRGVLMGVSVVTGVAKGEMARLLGLATFMVSAGALGSITVGGDSVD
jgi:hypothetical protein